MIKKKLLQLLTLCAFAILTTFMGRAETVGIFYDPSVEPIKFAAGDIKTALEAKGFTVEELSLSSLTTGYANKKVVLALSSSTATVSVFNSQGGATPTALTEQAYALISTSTGQNSHWVFGGDVTGTMYGGLQIAENISFYGYTGSYNVTEKPHLLNRGIKLNLAFDKRLPTYSGYWTAKSAQLCIKDVWDSVYWKKLIDQQARNRYNMLTVWSHHFFPALVKAPSYEKACLPNVQLYDGTILNMDLDARIAFFRKVMQYAHSRGMKFYFFNWNVCVDWAKDQYPAITAAQGNNTTIDYMSKSMLELLKNYPELDGFGISAGDAMYDWSSKTAKVDFTWKCYGQVVKDYMATQPNRKFDIIHRSIGAEFSDINPKFTVLNSAPNTSYRYSVKYTYAHAYSTPTPGKQWSALSAMSKDATKTRAFLTFRNEDFFYFNWGNYKFVSAIMKSILFPEIVDGFYLGSDNVSPTMSYLYKDNNLDKNLLDVERRWYTEMLWGRLSYNPNLSEDVLKNTMAVKYNNKTISTDLLTAWTKASAPLTRVTELVNDKWVNDYHWWPEACMSDSGPDPLRGNGFRVISGADGFDGTTPSSKNVCSIATSAAGTCKSPNLSSYQIADEMEKDASDAIALARTLSAGGDKELDIAIKNVQQMAYLSAYYARKIRGATLNKAGKTAEAQIEMGEAYCYWMAYTRRMDAMYEPETTRSVNIPNWKWADAKVLKEYTDLGGVGIPSSCPDDIDPFEEITVTANGCDSSTVSGGAKYHLTSPVKVCATPGADCKFVNWTENNAIVSTDSCYSFTFTGTRNLIATFAPKDQATYQVNISANIAGGTVIGGGKYAKDQEASVIASPYASYQFVGWTENGNIVSQNLKYSFKASANRDLVANFVKVTCPLPYTPPGKTYQAESPGVNDTWWGGRVNTGCYDEVSYSIDIAGVGGNDASDKCDVYLIKNGGAWELISGNIGKFDKKTISGTVKGSTSLELAVKILTSAGDETYVISNCIIKPTTTVPSNTITATVNGCDGSTVLGTGSLPTGETATICAKPSVTCSFVNWTEGGVEVSTDVCYSFVVDKDRALVANFAPKTFPCSLPWISENIIVNQATVIQSLGIIDISCLKDGATISFDLEGTGVDSSDYCGLYYKLNGGALTPLVEKKGAIATETFVIQGIKGSSLEIVVNAKNSFYDEFYYIRNITVVNDGDILPTFLISLSANGCVGTSVSGGGSKTTGTEVTVSAKTALGCGFVNWTENGTIVSTDANYKFTVDTARTLVANFKEVPLPTHNLTVNVNQSAWGTTSVSPATGPYKEGTNVTITANAANGYRLANWSGDATGKINPVVVSMTGPKTVTANFELTPKDSFTLTESSPGGVILFDPAGGKYPSGTVVKVTAEGNAGYKFSAWGGVLSGPTNPNYITVDANKLVTGTFVASTTTYSLITSAVNGSVTLSATGPYLEGTDVTLTPVPAKGYRFKIWSGIDASGTANPLIVDMSKNKSITAIFELIPASYTLAVNVVNGSVKLSPATGPYEDGTNVSLTATPADGYKFVKWSDDATGTDSTIVVKMSGNKTITANFESIVVTPSYILTASANPTDAGVLTGAGTYVKGQTATLKAAPVDNFIFDSWTENDSIVSKDTVLTITINSDRTFVANFSKVVTNIKNEIEDKVLIYPNPTSSILNIEFSNESSKREIVVYNSNNQMLYKAKANGINEKIDAKMLHYKGLIILHIIDDNKSSVFKAFVE